MCVIQEGPRLCLLAQLGWRGWAVQSKEEHVGRLDSLPALGRASKTELLWRAWGSAPPALESPASAMPVPPQALPTRTSRARTVSLCA